MVVNCDSPHLFHRSSTAPQSPPHLRRLLPGLPLPFRLCGLGIVLRLHHFLEGQCSCELDGVEHVLRLDEYLIYFFQCPALGFGVEEVEDYDREGVDRGVDDVVFEPDGGEADGCDFCYHCGGC